MSPHAPLALLFPAVLAGCQRGAGSGAGSGAGGVETQNLGLAARVLVGQSDLWLVQVREAEQGGLDGNADGDALDELVVVLDLEHDRVLRTGLAVGIQGAEPPLFACDGTSLAFAVDEAAQGGQDLNGDGDALDRVLFVLDREHGTTRNLGLAVRRVLVGGPLVACAVDERTHGNRDLDFDGDTTGSVLAVHDLRVGSTEVFTLRDSTPLLIHDERVALRLAERVGVDMTLDGDDQDTSVLEVYDGRTRLLQNTTLVLAGDALAGAQGTFGALVSEAGQGRGDLSGDGDADDWVFYVYDPGRGFSVNLGLAPPLHPPPAVDGRRYLIHAREEPSARDDNADGDLDDLVVYVFDPGSGILSNTGLASQGAAVLFHDWLGVGVSEIMQGATDLDGDGEVVGNVVHVLELGTGTNQNLGLDSFVLHGSAQRLFLTPLEAERGGAGGDGGPRPLVLADWAPDEGEARLGPAVGALLAVEGELALLQTPERVTRLDANADGDTDDLLLELFDARRGRIEALGLAVGSAARLLPDGRVLALVDELAQGHDLNADGDLADEVLHLTILR